MWAWTADNWHSQIDWKPCICTPAREAAERGRGMGHLLVFCNTCHDQLWQTTFYQPPGPDHYLAAERLLEEAESPEAPGLPPGT